MIFHHKQLNTHSYFFPRRRPEDCSLFLIHRNSFMRNDPEIKDTSTINFNYNPFDLHPLEKMSFESIPLKCLAIFRITDVFGKFSFIFF